MTHAIATHASKALPCGLRRASATTAMVLLASLMILVVPTGTEAQTAGLPAAEADARARLDASPRHGEWVEYDAGGGDLVRAWVVFPERAGPAPVVVVIHEIFGLTDWIRGVADQLAAEGFLAIAPDLLSGKAEGGRGTDGVDSQGAVALVRGLTPDEVERRLRGAATYATDLPAATSRVAMLGFCWGGTASFTMATVWPTLDASVVFYGSSPPDAALSGVRAPILGLYGEDDARVNLTIEPARSILAPLGVRFETELYPGAGHGFLRQQDGREGANLRATERAWPRAVEFLNETLATPGPSS
jgi:carboxymethylenebutenolidase